MERIKFKQHYKPGEILINEQQIAGRLSEMGPQIAGDFKDKDLLIVPILKGGQIVGADLQREIFRAGHKTNELSFTMIKTYEGTQSTGQVKVLFESDVSPKGRNILLVDDVIDKGISLHYLDKHMRERGAASVKSFSLLSKPDARVVDYEADYVGFEIPNVWVEGYGMDSNGRGRGNPNIIVGPSM